MIKSIYSKDLLVNQSQHPYNGPTGQVWWDGNTRSFKIVSGPGQSMDLGMDNVNLEFRPEVERILRWAERKMQEEDQLDQLCKKFPNLDEARREFEVLLALVKNRS